MNTRAAILALLCLASFAYFHEGGGWNQNSRFDLVRALIERHTVCIDAYHENTGDEALFRGHYYMDKAPGASFVALPAVAVARSVMRARGEDVNSPEALERLSYVAEVAGSGVPATVAALCVWWLVRRYERNEQTAMVVAVAYALGSPAWAYSVMFIGHALAVCCLLLAWCAASGIRESRTPRRDIGLALGAGLAAGWAVVTEYPVAVASVVLAGYVLAEAWPGGWTKRVRVAAALGVGALACAAVLMVYHQAAFGSPFRVGYEYYDNPATMKTGLLGINRPQWHILTELLWGWYRGLLPAAPVLVLAPVGLWLWWRRRETHAVAVSLTAAILAGLTLMSGDVHWEGGWAYGPRYIAFIMGFMFLGLAPVWTRSGRIGRAAMGILILVGVGTTLVAVSTTVQPMGDIMHPMRDYLWPAFKDGYLALNTQHIVEVRRAPWSSGRFAAWNGGQQLGLTGLASLLPLMAIWAACAVAYVRAGRRTTGT
jgi:hypothetical protein